MAPDEILLIVHILAGFTALTAAAVATLTKTLDGPHRWHVYVDWGEIDAPMIPLGGNEVLVQWQPGYPPATWSFVLADDRVAGFDWGPRPFRRAGGVEDDRP